MTIDAAPAHTRLARRRIGVLIVSNLLGGIGVASSVAVGGLLAEQIGGTASAGFAQAASVLGAAIAAVPLATLAARAGRRTALTVGYAASLAGAAVIVGAAILGQLVLLLAGMALFGVAQAVNLQSRYAAGDNASAASRGRIMSFVIWATTIGSVAGPNLSDAGNRFGHLFGLPDFVGAYLFSVIAIAAAGLVIGLFYGGERRGSRERDGGATADGGASDRDHDGPADHDLPDAGGSASTTAASDEPRSVAGSEKVGALAALRWAFRQPAARMAVVLTACAHAVMVMVMVMTPVHMHHHGDSLTVVGVVISLHVLGMYALSPLFGWLADRIGPVNTAAIGVGLLAVAIVLGLIAAGAGGLWTPTALVVLGVGWSASVISSSTVLAGTEDARYRLPLQGATDAGMNYAGAGAAAVAGTILGWGGFTALNLVALVLLLPAAALVVTALARR